MTDYPNYYALLEIAPEADPLAIRRAYRDKMVHARVHPDLGGEATAAAQLNEAYAVLRDPARRAAYDRLFLGHVIETPMPVAAPPPDERRRTLRQSYGGHLQIRPDHGPHLYPGQCRDISLGGLAFRSIAHMAVGTRVTIILADDPGLLLEGVLRWRRAIPQRFGAPIFEFGAEFRPVDHARFARFCAQVGLGE